MHFCLSLLAAAILAGTALTAPTPDNQPLAVLEFYAEGNCKTSVKVMHLEQNRCNQIPEGAKGVRIVQADGVKRNDIHASNKINCEKFDGLIPNVDHTTCYHLGGYKSVHVYTEN